MDLHDHINKWMKCTQCRLGTGWSHEGKLVNPRHPKKRLGHPVLFRMSNSCDGATRDIVFVGEAPGPSEDSLGWPFIGPAGKVLYCMIDDVGLTSYAITNVIACFPIDPEKFPDRRFREPSKEEALACAPRVQEFISLISPKGVVLLGRHAKRFVKTNLPTVSLLHPSAIGMEDNYTTDWEWRRRNNVSYKRSRDTLALFLESVL